MLKTLKSNALRFCKLTLPALALLLTACATTSVPIPQACPAVPMMPEVSTPQPQANYSLSAAQLIQKWRDRLTDTLQIR